MDVFKIGREARRPVGCPTVGGRHPLGGDHLSPGRSQSIFCANRLVTLADAEANVAVQRERVEEGGAAAAADDESDDE